MSPHVTNLGKTLSTIGTCVWFFTGVYSLVNLQLLVRWEGFLTHGALLKLMFYHHLMYSSCAVLVSHFNKEQINVYV